MSSEEQIYTEAGTAPHFMSLKMWSLRFSSISMAEGHEETLETVAHSVKIIGTGSLSIKQMKIPLPATSIISILIEERESMMGFFFFFIFV
jgi:hypothetical protein